ncbi:MAG: hypothetical protein ACLQUZ_07670 [Rhizomicrobium sp.]
MKSGPSVLHRTIVFSAAIIVSSALLAPVAAYAQTDQAVVLACVNDFNSAGRKTVTLDLAGKTITEEDFGGLFRSALQGTIVTNSDKQIVWNVEFPNTIRPEISTLSRYTLHLTVITPSNPPVTTEYTCQKQQRQF